MHDCMSPVFAVCRYNYHSVSTCMIVCIFEYMTKPTCTTILYIVCLHVQYPCFNANSGHKLTYVICPPLFLVFSSCLYTNRALHIPCLLWIRVLQESLRP